MGNSCGGMSAGLYTIYYFPPRGNSVAARLMLTHAGVPFNDVTIDFSEWPEYKPKSPTGTIPYIEIKGKLYSQTVAIHNYLAREHGYYGSSNLENLAIDQVVQTANEFFNESKKSFFGPDSTKDQMFKRHYDELLPKFGNSFVRFLKENGNTGYFVGKRITLADFEVFDVIHITEKKNKGSLAKYPELQDFYDKFSQIPKVKEYLARKPDAPF